jgi:hypothetical protein
MGEYADYAIDDMLAADDYALELYERGDFDADPDLSWSAFSRPRRRQFKVCKMCGEHGLRWGIHDDAWRLEERDGSLHACKFKGKFGGISRIS